MDTNLAQCHSVGYDSQDSVDDSLHAFRSNSMDINLPQCHSVGTDSQVSVASTSRKPSKSERTHSTFLKSMTNQSSGSAVNGAGKDIWSILTQRGYLATQKDAFDDVWHDDHDLHGSHESGGSCFICCKEVKYFFHGLAFELNHRLKAMWTYPLIILYSFLVFSCLTAGALITINVICDNMQQKIELDASLEAFQTASYFADAFAKSLIPLRSLQQAVIHSNTFQELPHLIGNYGADGSTPSIAGPVSEDNGSSAQGSKNIFSTKDFRNVTGICDDPELISEFQKIVEGVNHNFGFEDIIITYRIAPYGVYCLANPLTVDLAENKVLNSKMDIGWDPIHSENVRMKTMLRSIYHNQNSIFMFGPSPHFMNIPGLNIYCGHMAVEMPGYNYALDGEEKSIWGFVMHFINWSNLKKRSGIDAYYAEKEFSFQLSRTDFVVDAETRESSYKDVIIAQSDEFPASHVHFSSNGQAFDDSNSVKATVQT